MCKALSRAHKNGVPHFRPDNSWCFCPILQTRWTLRSAQVTQLVKWPCWDPNQVSVHLKPAFLIAIIFLNEELEKVLGLIKGRAACSCYFYVAFIFNQWPDSPMKPQAFTCYPKNSSPLLQRNSSPSPGPQVLLWLWIVSQYISNGSENPREHYCNL